MSNQENEARPVHPNPADRHPLRRHAESAVVEEHTGSRSWTRQVAPISHRVHVLHGDGDWCNAPSNGVKVLDGGGWGKNAYTSRS